MHFPGFRACMYNIYVLKQERPEMDEFERKKFGCEGKLSIFLKNVWKIAQVFNGYPYKNFMEYFCIFFCFITF